MSYRHIAPANPQINGWHPSSRPNGILSTSCPGLSARMADRIDRRLGDCRCQTGSCSIDMFPKRLDRSRKVLSHISRNCPFLRGFVFREFLWSPPHSMSGTPMVGSSGVWLPAPCGVSLGSVSQRGVRSQCTQSGWISLLINLCFSRYSGQKYRAPLLQILPHLLLSVLAPHAATTRHFVLPWPS